MIALPKQKNQLVAIAIVLILVALAGVAWTFLKMPTRQQKEVTQLNYTLKGDFTHQAYGDSGSDKPQPNAVYFTKTIDTVEASYTYNLLADKQIVNAQEQVEIRATLVSPGLWEKDVTLLPPTQENGDFTVTFPLDMERLLQLAKDISAELGAGAPAQEITLKAIVRTQAQTEKEPIQEEFAQTARVKMGAATVEFVRPFSQSRRGFIHGLAYEQKGAFFYTVQARQGTLYSDLSLDNMNQRPFPATAPAAKPLANPVYLTKAIDSLNASYSYSFLAERPIGGVEEDVRVSAIIGSSGVWEKEIVLVPPTHMKGDFTVSFPVDSSSLLQLARDVTAEVGGEAPSPEVTLRAAVHVTAQSEQGQLQQEFLQSAKIKSSGSTIELTRPFSQRSKGEFNGIRYEQRGAFDYAVAVKASTLYSPLSMNEIEQQAYLPAPPAKPLPNPIYFTKIIDSVATSFTYELRSEQPFPSKTEQIEVRALIGSSALWTKEVTLVPPTNETGDFSLAFPLDINGLLQIAKDIGAELDVETPIPDVTIKAIVRATGQTPKGQMQAEFAQTSKLKIGATTLELVRPTIQQKPGEFQGLRYEQRGRFSYVVQLKENKLFGRTVLQPDRELWSPAAWEKVPASPAPAPSQVLHPDPEPTPIPWWASPNQPKLALSPDPDSKPTPSAIKTALMYAADGLDHINMTFTYELATDRGVTSESHEVGVTAVLSAAGHAIQTFTLVPKTSRNGRFSITFPLDTRLIYAAMEAAEKDSTASTRPPFYSLAVRAEVNTTANTAFGAVRDILQQDLVIKLDKKSLQWPEVRPATKSGSIKQMTLAPSRSSRLARMGSLLALGVIVALLTYGFWYYRRRGFGPSVGMEDEARQAKAKHRDIMVDVESLPPVSGDERVIRLASLEELVKAADALLKPVLHETRPDRHTYCVTDGTSRYLYLNEASRRDQPAGPKYE